MSGFSEREVQLMACAFQAMKTPPEIDYQLMARLAGMSHPGSASNAMRAIRRKLDARVPGADGAAAGNGAAGTAAVTPVKKTPRSAAGKKRSAASMSKGTSGSYFDDDADHEEPGDLDNVDESPSKKIKGKGRSRAGDGGPSAVKVKQEPRGEHEDEAFVEDDTDIEEV